MRDEMLFDGGYPDFGVWNLIEKKRTLCIKLPSRTGFTTSDEDSKLFFSPDNSLLTYLGDVANSPFRLVIETRTGRVLWRAPETSNATFVGDKIVLSNADTFEICNARTGKLARRLNALPKTTPISSPFNDWLYSVDEDGGLFRQRLR